MSTSRFAGQGKARQEKIRYGKKRKDKVKDNVKNKDQTRGDNTTNLSR
jgi:hypothetical protein